MAAFSVTAGIIGIATLLSCEAIFGQIRSNIYIHKVLHVQPTVVLAHGEPQPDLMRKTHVTHDDIMSSLRRAGIADPAQVRCIVLEPSGSLSVLRRGTPLGPQVLKSVLGAGRVLSDESPDLD